jgi:hypothetical protein
MCALCPENAAACPDRNRIAQAMADAVEQERAKGHKRLMDFINKLKAEADAPP